jgi:poly-gamma-glutamate capsule biosynthesis protein CapA/YwtB (metallophosphatase superfamily)
MASATTLVLAGDVMTGRGIDQILGKPGAPGLREEYVVDARAYVDLAERANGPIPKPVDDAWPWGDALAVMEGAGPAVRVMNLETSVTRSEETDPGKGIHYRMSPANVGCLATARADVWTLANNHVLDHGRSGLLETVETFHRAGLRGAGAGRDADEAWAAVAVECGDARVVVCSVAHASSGVPVSWAAAPGRAGVALLPDLSDATAEMVADAARRGGRPGDLRVVSVHWGGNWGSRVPRDHRRFAHRLVDAGVHVVHGHSSHHPRPVEVYRGHLVIYGCGDLVDDYEGITGYEQYRDDLRVLFLARLRPGTGELQGLSMPVFQARRMRLWRARPADVAWLAEKLGEDCRAFGTGFSVEADGSLHLVAGG